ncbi:MAG TPA: NAD(P)/FAD-dependent oxidoreductase [Alphaproteobacteria bacterium]|nr:NAD(P)/FAD-dependent oxidoreductase [Alphaproteobacteria bacterium]
MGSGSRIAPDFEVAIIGAGFSGLGMAIRLKKAGIDSFVILEKAAEVGGTWRENTYPGCACDIPSSLYSFSFEPRGNWSRTYPPQPEILAYLIDCADKHGLRARTRFGTELVGASFDEAASLWRLAIAEGPELTCRFLILATGPLAKPAYPKLPGLDRFEGAAFHSAEWDHAFDPTGKRVAVIGTGASAIQFVPQLAPQAASLHVYQRTPPWVLPKADAPVARQAPSWRRWLARQKAFWGHEMTGAGFAVEPRLMALVERQAREYLHAQIADPDLRMRLSPDYRLGCKRVLISDDYYPALDRPNVELITSPIAEVRARSVIAAGGEREVDAIIFGTGFRATDFLDSIRIAGRGGNALGDAWRDGAEAYLGTAVAGYPNMFLLVGPNTGLGHNSLVFMIEAQLDHVVRCLAETRRRGASVLEVDGAAQIRFNERLRRRMRRTVWMTGCKSWYLDRNGRNTTLWPGFAVEYWWRTSRPRFSDYRFAGG